MWSELPFLSALRAFEAAARNGSLSAGARELNVTHAAIAQHVRSLETHFGTGLLERQGRGMVTTAAGHRLARELGEGFGLIAEAVRQLAASRNTGPLRLSTTPTFASAWLMPRLKLFWQAHPDIRLEILPTTEVVDLRTDGIDLAIRFGRGSWAGVHSEELFAANWAVVGHPDVVAGRFVSDLRDLADETFLIEQGNGEETMWLERQGLDLTAVRTQAFTTVELVTEAARGGLGLTMITSAIAEPDVRAGRLEVVYEEVGDPHGYHVVTRPGTVSAQRATFIRWLRREAAERR